MFSILSAALIKVFKYFTFIGLSFNDDVMYERNVWW